MQTNIAKRGDLKKRTTRHFTHHNKAAINPNTVLWFVEFKAMSTTTNNYQIKNQTQDLRSEARTARNGGGEKTLSCTPSEKPQASQNSGDYSRKRSNKRASSYYCNSTSVYANSLKIKLAHTNYQAVGYPRCVRAQSMENTRSGECTADKVLLLFTVKTAATAIYR